MNKKGVSLPVNVLVVLAIAIVVLLGVITFFSGSLTPTQESMTRQRALNMACTSFVQSGGCSAGNPGAIASSIKTPGVEEDNLEKLAGKMGTSAKSVCCGTEDTDLEQPEE
ncbi:MAG: hypothetical protein ABEK36_00390 [Candidatus Aenigmatarchaeota archaeon]